MQLGIVGKPNVGKSTFFNAATNAQAEIANYPFTTIDANRGVMYIRKPCPCKEFNVVCNPHNAECKDGIRFVPIEAIDVAGLVPGAHQGKGLGNKFLDDLRQAHVLIHILDGSGGTDAEGNPCQQGSYDPLQDVRFLEEEITFWIRDILQRSWEKIARQSEVENKNISYMLQEKLAGLGMTDEHIVAGIKHAHLTEKKPTKWTDDDLLQLCKFVRTVSKPIIIAFNKSDTASPEHMQKLDDLKKQGYWVVSTSAESELALVHAAKKGIINYIPGSSSFSICDKNALNTKQQQALHYIKTCVLDKYGSTGVQNCIDQAVNMLNLIVVYPVQDEMHLTDKEGRVLPDAFLVPRGTTAKQLAFLVHSDLGNHFIRAIDVRSRRVIGAHHELQDGDVISIIANV